MSERARHSQTLQDLMELTSRLSQDRDLEDALQQISDAALRLLSADHTSVRLVDEAEKGLLSYARSGRGRGGRPVRLLLGEGVGGWVCEHGQPVRIADVEQDERFKKAPRQGFTIRSLLAVPIWVSGEVVGVLAATSAAAGAFSTDDETQARLLANCAVPMIERARGAQLTVLPQLEHAMASPLRLHLVSELLEADEYGISLEQAVLRSGRHLQDVQACLRPLVRWQILDELDGQGGFRLRSDVSPETLAALHAIVRKRADQLGRERHVRHQLLGGMIGIDPKMQVVFGIVRQVARIDVSVLITGETGTGKELVARSIHDTSPRRECFFGAVNCATLTETLFESQVFGHVRGAFTGAVQDFIGLVQRCEGGTLFLDEVGDLSLPNQVKLLRLLQEGTFTRLGETTPRSSDFRLVAATNRDLEAMVREGSFREDLYYRLAVFPVRIPSLRERSGDIEYLVDGILAGHARRFGRGGEPAVITPRAILQLEKHRWPGNVRELENVLARAVIMAGDGPIGPEHLPDVELAADSSRSDSADEELPPSRRAEDRSLREVEREHVARVLREQGGNIKATAQVLGVSRTTLYKKLKDYRIGAK